MDTREQAQINIPPIDLLKTSAEGSPILPKNIADVPGGSALLLGFFRSYVFKKSQQGWELNANGDATFGVIALVPLAADPVTTQEGATYYNSTAKKLKFYDGTAWRTVTST